ncbi:hypothetical protein GCM10011571_26060 [Marinithermofilum abyssi]|uniref:Uncharacterized protein n=1 Tax=Marinithermofilum abyssi TaxID=1571185 RepID=A0A8J2VC74_9BACL|nr:hypothetical protein [Marinithermofilum abyssi]GGE22780.1 hypothetical protein GCM10011571_26060 [Marinithermofilum abyssi]
MAASWADYDPAVSVDGLAPEQWWMTGLATAGWLSSFLLAIQTNASNKEDQKGTLSFDHSPCVNAGDSWVIPSTDRKLTKLTPWAPRLTV